MENYLVIYFVHAILVRKRDIEIQQNLGVGRTIYYEKKRKALEYLGFYFYCIVIPQSELLLVETN